ncbi:MAG: site-specific integrase, partial [Nitrospirae bacterium]
LLDHAKPPADRLLALLLAGLSPEEVAALRQGDIDPGSGTVRVAGPAARSLPLPAAVLPLLRGAAAADPAAPAVAGAAGSPLSPEALTQLLQGIAEEAGLSRPEEVTPEAVRHTYLAHLVRQGLDPAELPRIAGPLPPPVAAAYARLAPRGRGRTWEEIDATPPGM